MKRFVPLAAWLAAIMFPLAAKGQTIDHRPDTPAGALRHIAHGDAAYSQGGAFVSNRIGADKYEITFSVRSFASRDQVESYLLYRAALLTRGSGHGWSTLLHVPGERGTDDHPAERNPSFGEVYRHWQPHWNYYVTGEAGHPGIPNSEAGSGRKPSKPGVPSISILR